jgi:radical SAM protein with 4Fe4S-binding SPASM domain
MFRKLVIWVHSGSGPLLRELAKRVFKSRWLLENPAYQSFILKRVARIDDNVVALKPFISIETILTCNARCVMCVHGEQPMIGTMDEELFRKIVDQAAAMGAKAVGLSIYGEPFADKNFVERVAYVRAKGLSYSLFSNGSLLREDRIKRMLDLGGFESINFSVNGFSKEIYENVMPPLNREKVYGKINDFLKQCLAHPGKKPFVRISCVGLDENRAEQKDYLDYWQSRPGVDHVLIADQGDWLGELSYGQSQDQNAATRGGGVKEAWLSPCQSLWSSLYVYYDGRVSPCCEDAAARNLIIGDCREEALADIWRGHAISALRAQHRNNQRGGHATCGKCHWNQPWFKSPEVEAAAGAEQKTASAPMPAMMPRSWHLRETLE